MNDNNNTSTVWTKANYPTTPCFEEHGLVSNINTIHCTEIAKVNNCLKHYYFDEHADAPIAKPANARFGGAFYEPSADQFIYIERVVYNKPNTIVIFSDGTRTTCTCNDKDNYDREKGLLICVMKRMFGSDYVMNLMGDWAFGDKITLCLKDVRTHQNNK